MIFLFIIEQLMRDENFYVFLEQAILQSFNLFS